MKIIEMVMTRGYLLEEDDHYGIDEFKEEDIVANNDGKNENKWLIIRKVSDC